MNKKISIALCLTVLLSPLSSQAVMISADDTVAGLGTDIDIEEAVPGTELTLVITPPLGPEAEATVAIENDGTANVHLPGMETEIAGAYGVSIEQDGLEVASSTFEVLTDQVSAQQSVLQAQSSMIHADGSDTTTVTVTLRDHYGNPLPGKLIKLVSSLAGDTIVPLGQATNELGQQQFQISSFEPGVRTIRAMDFVTGTMLESSITLSALDPKSAVGGPYNQGRPALSQGTQRPVSPYGSPFAGNLLGGSGLHGRSLYGQVTTGLVHHFEIVAPETMNLNEDGTIRIIALDQYGNKVDDYVGTTLLSSTDPQAYLPLNGKVPFLPQNLGEKVLTLGLRFRSSGDPVVGGLPGESEHLLYVEDANNPSVFGEKTIIISGGKAAAPVEAISIRKPEKGTLFSEAEVVIEGTAQPFINLKAKGGKEVVFGESDINGKFSITVNLDESLSEHTLVVTDEFEEIESEKINVRLDVTAPVIKAITFSPEEPTEETKVVIAVESEEGLRSVTADIAGETLTLNPSAAEPGTYQAVFTAPEGDLYEVSVTATDDVGHSITQTTSLSVALRGLPQVQNVTAVPEHDGITVQWDPITAEAVDAYRIYVGETPTEFSFSLDTNFPTSAAQVAGLRPGSNYYFAVTALQGPRESAKKSQVIKATMLGLRLDTVAQDGSLLLDWSSFNTNTPLASFILEYGVEHGIFTEKRILNGDLRTYVLRDLINDVQYFIKLTPVAVTGELQKDFAAQTEGTPTSLLAGFRTTRATPAPVNLRGSAPPEPKEQRHRGAPSTPPSGAPTWVWGLIALLAAGGTLTWIQRRRKLQTAAFMQTMNQQYSRFI